MDGWLVGTGALLVGEVDGQIVRVSVAPAHRRRGLARAIVEALVTEALVRGLDSVWVETNDDWEDAIALYQSIGFLPYDHREGCIFLCMDLNAQL
jgi:ribosomal protein S18 acetylase RimI-like enzyme